jgi:hypothetical protein
MIYACLWAGPGIAAYESWAPTVSSLCEAGVPTLITDFCEEAAHLARQVVQSQADKRPTKPAVSEIQVNAFRKPLSCQGDDNLLPSYSNSFLFWLSKSSRK